jgi:RHS repeat-associated protein
MVARSATNALGGLYRYGFIGKEHEDETVGGDYDFGARMYDSRICRWLSIDPKIFLYPGLTPFNYALNSPILFLDVEGKDPKVAIILANKDGSYYEFDDHYKALEAQGYTVLRAQTGEEALKLMQQYGTPESPIESLILISHASPGGLSNGNGNGIYTQMEVESMAKEGWMNSKWKAFSASKGFTDNLDDPDAYMQLYKEFEVLANEEWENVKTTVANDYLSKSKAKTVQDIAKMIAQRQIHTKSLTIVLGGCNSAGYKIADDQNIFAEELATATGATVYASKGYTEPEQVNGKTVKSTKRTSTFTWLKIDPKGKIVDLLIKTLDLAAPQKNVKSSK